MKRNDLNGPAITSWEYIKDNFQPDDHLAVLIKNSSKNQLIQRLVTADQLATPRYQAWLRFENAQGADIYVSMNSLKPDARGRTKNDIEVVRHLYLDLDHNGLQSLNAICNDSSLPKPSYVLNTSEGKYQVIWKVIAHNIEKAEILQRAMALQHGADRAATDVSRVLRIPGFYNCKYDPPFKVAAEKLSFVTYILSDFRIQHEALPQTSDPTASPHQQGHRFAGLASQSERDWAETLQRLERGQSPSSVEAWLEQKRQDKHDPAYYASLTVQKAVAERENRHAANLAVEL